METSSLFTRLPVCELHMTPRPEHLPVRAHPKVPKQGSRTDLETMVRSNQESRSKGNFVGMRQVQGQAIKLAWRLGLGWDTAIARQIHCDKAGPRN